ncbi:glycosyltransferase [bacterium]|nr:MAG: glycosyltransferase [bacterium]
MKIFITHLTLGKNIFAGVEKSVYNLVLGLLDIGIDVVVYTGCLGENSGISKMIKVYFSLYLQKIFPDDMRKVDRSILRHYKINMSKINIELGLILLKEKPDYVLVIDQLWGIIPLADVFQIDLNCKFGLVFHMVSNLDILNKVSEMPFKHLFSVSHYLTKKLYKFCPDLQKKKILLLPNSIQVDAFSKDRLLGEEDYIFCNARLSPEKGIENLIYAFIEVLRNTSNTYLWLCSGQFHFGNNKNTIKSIRKIISQNPILEEKIIFLPILEWLDIPKFLQRSKIVVLPTKDETFGIAALEAMAAGVPLIASNVGNLPDLVQDSGFLVDYGNINGMTELMVNILANKKEVSLMVERGRIISQDYDNKIIARSFIETIMEV